MSKTKFQSTKLKKVKLSGGFCVNCIERDGKVRPAFSPTRAEGIPLAGLTFAAHSEKIDRFFIADYNALYATQNGNFPSLLVTNTGGGKPFFYEEVGADGTPYAVIGINDIGVRHNGSGFTPMRYSEAFRCAVMRKGRLFAASLADGLKIIWSEGGNSFGGGQSLSGAGWVKLQPALGDICDMLDFDDRLIVLRKLGITVLSVYGSAENFKTESVDYPSDEVVPGTACIVNGNVIFCTASGVKIFNGSGISRYEHAYSGDILSPKLAATYNGAYYLTYTSKKLNRPAVLCLGKEACFVMDIEARALAANCGMVVFTDIGVYKLEEGAGDYTWYPPTQSFGSRKPKTLNYIEVSGGVTVEVSTGEKVRTFANGKTHAGLRGEKFGFKVTGNEAAEIAVCAEVEDEV